MIMKSTSVSSMKYLLSSNMILFLRGFRAFIERKTFNFIIKLREIFPWRETALRAHGMKSDKQLFFCQIYAIFLEEMVHVVIDGYCFFLISEEF